jgi:hypothetical protein
LTMVETVISGSISRRGCVQVMIAMDNRSPMTTNNSNH